MNHESKIFLAGHRGQQHLEGGVYLPEHDDRHQCYPRGVPGRGAEAGKPGGCVGELMDVSRMTELGWTASTSLREGIEKTWAWYQSASSR